MDTLNNDGIDPNMAESGALGPGIPLGGGLEEDGAAEDEEIVRGEAAGGIGLEVSGDACLVCDGCAPPHLPVMAADGDERSAEIVMHSAQQQ